MNDLISRQAAIEELKEKVFHNLTDEFYGAMQVLNELPAAKESQPAQAKCDGCYQMRLGRPSCSWCARNYPDRYSKGED